jgi:hypothetical protein
MEKPLAGGAPRFGHVGTHVECSRAVLLFWVSVGCYNWYGRIYYCPVTKLW